MRPATIRRMMARPTFPEELELHRLDCMVSHRKLDNYCRLLDALVDVRNEPVLPPPLLRGRDLLDLGIPEGPMIGRILKEVETRRLDGEFHTREEALAWVRQHYAS